MFKYLFFKAPAFIVCLVPFVAADFEAPKFTLDLNLPPTDRWTEITTFVVSSHGWENTYGPLLGYFEDDFGHEFFVENDDQIKNAVFSKMPEEYKEELTGIYSTLVNMGYESNITLGEIGLLQLYYELNPFCTGMLVEDSDGDMLHGRNMDYSLPGLANITVSVDFVADALSPSPEVILQSTTFVGYVGVVTGMRRGGWAIQANQRFKLEIPYINTFIKAAEGYSPAGFAIRNELIATSDYATAVDNLRKAHLMAPLYLIISGLEKGEGKVLIFLSDLRGDGDVNPRHFGERTLGEDGAFYLVQTNHDPWESWASDGREEFAEAELQKLGQDAVNLDAMRDILSTPPSLAKTTVYTTMMSASKGVFDATVRTHDDDNE